MPIEKPVNHGILPSKVPTLRELLKGALRGQYPSNYPKILSFPQKKSTSKQGEEDVPPLPYLSILRTLNFLEDIGDTVNNEKMHTLHT